MSDTPICSSLPAADTPFDHINPNLLPSWKIRVGYNRDSRAIFCLGGANDSNSDSSCYYDKTIHSALSRFNLNDYIDVDSEANNSDDEEETPSPLSIENIGSLVVGTWLDCLHTDELYYEAMFLTADQNLSEGYIGIMYDDPREKEWVPISWCQVPARTMKPNQCDASVDAAESICDYIPTDFGENDYNEAYVALLRRAFNEIAHMKRETGGFGKQQQLNMNSGGSLSRKLHDGGKEQGKDKVLFSYALFPEPVQNKGYMEIGAELNPLPIEMDSSVYRAIYSLVPMLSEQVQQLDDKHKLSQLLLGDPKAASVFPKSYPSYKEALLSTKAEHDGGGNVAFYIKDSTGTRGEGIEIQTWEELSTEYDRLMEEGEYDVDGGEEDIVIQRAVTDLHTIGGEGPISGRRFDIRFYVLVTNGSVYIHSSMLFSWLLNGAKYDPTDTKIENQVMNAVEYSGSGEKVRLYLADSATEWNNIKEHRGSSDRSRSIPSDGFDPFGWRYAVADALEKASGIFTTLKKLTEDNPKKYVFAGGDAMIKEDGSAVLVEFNVFPDTTITYKSLVKCLEGGVCPRFVIMSDANDNGGASYQVTPPTLAAGIVSSECIAEVYRDVISMVMGLQPDNEIENFREIVPRAEH